MSHPLGVYDFMLVLYTVTIGAGRQGGNMEEALLISFQ